ncbi:recombinase [Klebsiella pneumoniae subsp. pneumoniae]|nr:recombinase [Klebsiella pneumoniae]MBP2828026.1 recombinase [Klebsiella pneumoniae subsp. pneumoniae]HDU3676159.1 recombinase [Klebsiella pneumoniae subsp. ozaenae]EKU6510830.1 recombinase [Klebsiella pneumoniae]MBC4911005.1 recombinase [Klebsiella pneumoniae]
MRDNHTQISNIAGDLSMNMSPWNKDRIIGQKRPLQISHICGIRILLELEGKTRDLALFNMALDSKLRGCDLVNLKVSDVEYGMLGFKQSNGKNLGPR